MNNGFAGLFNITEEDLNKRKAGKQENAAKSNGKKSGKGTGKKAESRSIRHELPVRVRCGYIYKDFTVEECGGKSLDENTIKIKLREQYPELSGVSFMLADISATIAAVNEEKRKECESAPKRLVDTDASGGENAIEDSVSNNEKNSESISSEDAKAPEEKSIPANQSGMEKASLEVPEFASADSKEASAEVLIEKNDGGSWLTLQIYYQEIGENQKLTFPLTLVNGEYKIPVDQVMGMEALRQLWVDSYPEYKGCKLYYDDQHNLLVPFMEIKKDQELSVMEFTLPITVGYLNFTRVFTCMDFGEKERGTATLEEIRKLYGAVYPEYRFSTYYFNEEDNLLFPVITKEEKISGRERLPVPVRVRVIGTEIILQESDFKGKRTVSLEEIRQVLEGIYPEYSKERTEMLVDATGFVVPILRGSRKGYYVVPNKYGEGLYLVKGRDGYEHRVEKTPFGTFECRVDGTNPKFCLEAPKVPNEILNQVLSFFRKTPTKEAAIQLFYLRETKTYEIYIPEQKSTDCTVYFERNWEKENQAVLFMDIHSHGKYPAFFSSVDNDDEKGTRLYLVIGTLDMDPISYSWRIRAGIAGAYESLKLEDIFEGGVYYGL